MKLTPSLRARSIVAALPARHARRSLWLADDHGRDVHVVAVGIPRELEPLEPHHHAGGEPLHADESLLLQVELNCWPSRYRAIPYRIQSDIVEADAFHPDFGIHGVDDDTNINANIYDKLLVKFSNYFIELALFMMKNNGSS